MCEEILNSEFLVVMVAVQKKLTLNFLRRRVRFLAINKDICCQIRLLTVRCTTSSLKASQTRLLRSSCAKWVIHREMWPIPAFVLIPRITMDAAYFSKAIPSYLLKLSWISLIWLLEKFWSEPWSRAAKRVSCIYDEICSSGSILV